MTPVPVTLDDVIRAAQRSSAYPREVDVEDLRQAAAFLLGTPTISVGDAVLTAPPRRTTT